MQEGGAPAYRQAFVGAQALEVALLGRLALGDGPYRLVVLLLAVHRARHPAAACGQPRAAATAAVETAVMGLPWSPILRLARWTDPRADMTTHPRTTRVGRSPGARRPFGLIGSSWRLPLSQHSLYALQPGNPENQSVLLDRLGLPKLHTPLSHATTAALTARRCIPRCVRSKPRRCSAARRPGRPCSRPPGCLPGC